MNQHRSRTMAFICLLALFISPLSSVNSFAQEQNQVKQEQDQVKKKKAEAEALTEKIALPPDAQSKQIFENVMADTFKLIEAKLAFEKTVKGAPYSATAVTETTQTLSDGNQIIRKTEVTIYRDREGRTRREQTLEAVGKWPAGSNPPQVIYINDPVTGISYVLDPSTQNARKAQSPSDKLIELDQVKMKMMDMDKMKKEAAIEADKAELKMKDAAKEMKVTAKDKAGQITNEVSGPKAEKKAESLGKQMVEGVEAEGKRVTVTIPSGQIGNTLPLEIVDEQWYSSELQALVMTKHHDPRSGDTIYRLTNINRSEPDRSLFEVPGGYTLNDDSALRAKKKMIEEKLDQQ